MPDEPTDEALMTAYAAGDAAAFERLYARHRGGLWRFVRRLLIDLAAAQAEEVFQDVWLRVVQSRWRWQPHEGATFKTWLYTLAHHRAIDLWRRGGREVADGGAPETVADDGVGAWRQWPAPAPAATPHGDEIAFWRRAGERLLACVRGLPAPQRSAFLLHHEDGLSLAEMAQALGVGAETAKTRLRYAMAKLRSCMGAYLAPLGAVEGGRR